MVNFKDVKKDSIFKYVEKIKANDGVVLGYELLYDLCYYSPRYNKQVIAYKGTRSDGATYAPDLDSFAWLFHDELCTDGTFEDGTICTNLQASHVLSDIMAEQGRWFRKYTWFIGTWLFGGGRARANGMW